MYMSYIYIYIYIFFFCLLSFVWAFFVFCSMFFYPVLIHKKLICIDRRRSFCFSLEAETCVCLVCLCVCFCLSCVYVCVSFFFRLFLTELYRTFQCTHFNTFPLSLHSTKNEQEKEKNIRTHFCFVFFFFITVRWWMKINFLFYAFLFCMLRVCLVFALFLLVFTHNFYRIVNFQQNFRCLPP